MAMLGSHRRRLAALLLGNALLLLSSPAVAQTRPTASLWVGGGFGGQLDEVPIVSVGVRVQNVGLAFYQAVSLDEIPFLDGVSADPVSGSEVDSVRGFDLLYFTGVSRHVVAYTGGGYYFEKGCSSLLLSVVQRSCEGAYKEKRFSYTGGVHFSPNLFVVGYGYHSFKGHEIMLGLRF